jgi:tetratricopeptide (TPR) repeat protein
MNRKLEVCAVGVLVASGALFAQDDEWKRLMERGQALERDADYSQAAASYRDAVKIREAGSSDRRLMISLNSLGLAYEEMGRFPDAERYFRRALGMLGESGGNNKLDRALLLTNLALLERETGHTTKSEALLHQAIAIETETLPPDDARLTQARAALAELVLIDGRHQEAERMLQEVLAAFEQRPERWQQEIGTILGDLGIVRHFQGRNDEAIQLFRQAIAIHEAGLGPMHPILIRPLINLARIQAASGRQDDADAIFRRAVQIAEQRLGPEHPAYSDVMKSYAAFLRATGHKREAKVMEAQARGARQGIDRRDGVGLTVDASAFRP